MLRKSVHTLPLAAVSLSTAERFETIVVGGGVAGCIIAGKLLSERNNVLVVERGLNVLTQPDWHYNMPACAIANRYLNPSYVHRTKQTVDQSKLNDIFSSAEGFASKQQQQQQQDTSASSSSSSSAAAASEGKGTSIVKPAATASYDLETPNVLGGAHIVLGSKTWFRGVQADWEGSGMPWGFDPNFVIQMRRLESIPPRPESRLKGFEGWSPTVATLRGKRGAFKLSPPVQTSKLYRPVLEALVNRGCSLTREWDPDQPPVTVGAGRINNVMVHNLAGCALSSLNCYLAPHLQITNCVTRGDVTSLVIDPESPGTVRGVAMINEKGEEQTVLADRVVLTAGAASTPRILLETQRRHPQHVKLPDAVGAGLWVAPSLTLRYGFNQEVTLAALHTKLVQTMALLEWRRTSSGWGMSAFDDMVCFLDTKTNGPASVRVNIQPFLTNSAGVEEAHGFQLVLRLVRPKSRGSVSLVRGGDKTETDFGALTHDDDVAALKEAAQFVSSAISKYFDGSKLAMRATPRTVDFSLDGPVGGGCCLGSAAVDHETFLAATFDNVYLGDASLLPNGQAADTHLTTMCLAQMSHTASLGRKLGSLD